MRGKRDALNLVFAHAPNAGATPLSNRSAVSTSAAGQSRAQIANNAATGGDGNKPFAQRLFIARRLRTLTLSAVGANMPMQFGAADSSLERRTSSIKHQTAVDCLANAQISALVVMSTSPPKPRVESSNLSAPATKTPEIARFQAFFISFGAARGLAILPRRRAKFQIVHWVTRFRNCSVWYSINKASRGGGCGLATNWS